MRHDRSLDIPCLQARHYHYVRRTASLALILVIGLFLEEVKLSTTCNHIYRYNLTGTDWDGMAIRGHV